jgi:hypothetical protein
VTRPTPRTPERESLLRVVDRTLTQRQWLEKHRPELNERVATALRERLADAEVPAA